MAGVELASNVYFATFKKSGDKLGFEFNAAYSFKCIYIRVRTKSKEGYNMRFMFMCYGMGESAQAGSLLKFVERKGVECLFIAGEENAYRYAKGIGFNPKKSSGPERVKALIEDFKPSCYTSLQFKDNSLNDNRTTVSQAVSGFIRLKLVVRSNI